MRVCKNSLLRHLRCSFQNHTISAINSCNLTGLYEGMEKITFEKPAGENNIQVGGHVL